MISIGCCLTPPEHPVPKNTVNRQRPSLKVHFFFQNPSLWVWRDRRRAAKPRRGKSVCSPANYFQQRNWPKQIVSFSLWTNY
jgi:hypothetical protein